MIDYVKTCLNKYADFSGRARRSEFWFFYLAVIIITNVAAIIFSAIGVGFVASIISLALCIPTLAAGVRRVHDTGKSGWFILIPIYNIILFATEGDAAANEYGENPKL